MRLARSALMAPRPRVRPMASSAASCTSLSGKRVSIISYTPSTDMRTASDAWGGGGQASGGRRRGSRHDWLGDGIVEAARRCINATGRRRAGQVNGQEGAVARLGRATSWRAAAAM